MPKHHRFKKRQCTGLLRQTVVTFCTYLARSGKVHSLCLNFAAHLLKVVEDLSVGRFQEVSSVRYMCIARDAGKHYPLCSTGTNADLLRLVQERCPLLQLGQICMAASYKGSERGKMRNQA